VYGGWPASFATAYALLQQQAIPLPHLYAALAPQSDFPYYCNVMERLPGEAVETVRARLSGASLASIDRVIGQYLGTIHQISRSYHGWAHLAAPYPFSWRDTFFTAIDIIVERACVHRVIAERRQQIAQVVAQYAATWSDPTRFVLSHHDGFQAMMVGVGNDWIASGVIDIEDYCFADPRLILSVLELYLIDFKTGRAQEPLAESFWEAYQQQCVREHTYTHVRPLFQLYILLDWLKDVPVTEQHTINSLTPHIYLRCMAPG
jgi:Ser/Thr protein kinase RdoA (MazF antagonist)